MLTVSEVALLVAGIAVVGTVATVVQKRFADRRDAWWVRTQWALERILAAGDDDTERAIALVLITSLQKSDLATREERKMLDEVADAMLPPPPSV
jgi:hypothetical protein